MFARESRKGGLSGANELYTCGSMLGYVCVAMKLTVFSNKDLTYPA